MSWRCRVRPSSRRPDGGRGRGPVATTPGPFGVVTLRYAPVVNTVSFSVEGQVALVTGATGGIGADLAMAFGQAGARVGVAGRAGERVRAVVGAIRAAVGEASPI